MYFAIHSHVVLHDFPISNISLMAAFKGLIYEECTIHTSTGTGKDKNIIKIKLKKF